MSPQPTTSFRKRSCLTLKNKLHIINKFQSGEKVAQIAKSLNLPDSTVRCIIHDKKRILAACKNESVLNSSIIRKHHGLIALMEIRLKAWCDQQRRENIPLTRVSICQQAISLYEEMKIEYGEGAKHDKFLASKGWYVRFQRRCKENELISEEDDVPIGTLCKSEIIEQKELRTEGVSNFSDKIKSLIDEGEYTPQTIFTVDEIGLYWKKLPDSEFISGEEQTMSSFNESKDRLNLLLCGNANGDLKLKPLVVYRMENPRALHKKSKGGLPVIWKSNSRAILTASLFEDWFGNYFIAEVERYCHTNNIPYKVLLILNSAAHHPPSTLVNFDHRINIIFVPPEEASSIHPRYEEIGNIFKAVYTRGVFGHFAEGTRFSELVTGEALWKEFNILDAVRIIADSWMELPDVHWQTCWNKLCLLFDNTESYECIISKIISEILNLCQEIEMKVTRENISDLLDSHSQMLTIEELMEMQEHSANEEMDIQDPLCNEESMTVENLTEAISHIKMGLQIIENIDPNEQRARLTRLGVTKLLRSYEEILCQKVMVQDSAGNFKASQ